MPTIDALQQIRNGCAPRRPTPQKKALATADLVRDSRLGEFKSLLSLMSHPEGQHDHHYNSDGDANESEFTVITFA